jgi:Mrp family chromosome partitioning ATPase
VSGACDSDSFAQAEAEAKVRPEKRGGAAMARRKAAPKDAAPKDAAKDAAKAPARMAAAGEKPPSDSVYIGLSEKPEFIWLRLANRHGLVTGATGTGKTVTLQGLAEGFSDQGVPVFCADVKGDLSGIAEKGQPRSRLEERDKLLGYDPHVQADPVIF